MNLSLKMPPAIIAQHIISQLVFMVELELFLSTTFLKGTVMEYLSGKIFRYRTILFPLVNLRGAERAFSMAISVFDRLLKISGIRFYARWFFSRLLSRGIEGSHLGDAPIIFKSKK